MLSKTKKKSERILFFAIFLINPFLGIISTAWRIVNNKKCFSLCVMLVFMIALYMTAINTTKTIVGDEEQYVTMFRSVPSNGFSGTLSYLTKGESSKEILYGSFVYFLYYVSFGSVTFFIATTSFLIYFLFLISIYKFGKEYNTPSYIVVAGIITISFFTQHFNLTTHLIRQFLATSFLFYALSLRNSYKKLSISLTLLSFFIHNSMIVLILLSLIPSIDKYYSNKKLLIILALSIVFTFSFTSIAGSLLGVFGQSSGSGEVLQRASEAEGLIDLSGQMDSQLINLIAIPLIVLSIYGIQVKLKTVPPIILNMSLLISVFVINLSFSPLLQYRYFYLLYSFLPFILYVPLRRIEKLSKLYCLGGCIFMIIRFYMTYGSTWDYLPLSNALLLPYPLIFIMN